jgi:predicted HTH domain antitoxin
MRTITLKLPETADIDEKEALLAITSRLYEKGKLSLGEAAEVAHLE